MTSVQKKKILALKARLIGGYIRDDSRFQCFDLQGDHTPGALPQG